MSLNNMNNQNRFLTNFCRKTVACYIRYKLCYIYHKAYKSLVINLHHQLTLPDMYG